MKIFSIEELIINPSFINSCLQLDEKDIDFWDQYLSQNPDQIATIDEAKSLVNIGKFILIADEQKPTEWSKIEQKISKRKTVIQRLLTYAAAASLLLVFYIGYLVFFNKETSTKQINYLAYADYKKSYTLPDSSFILLDKGAEISLGDNFSKGKRMLSLNGSAYFKVAKDSLHPFSVKAGNYIVTAIGTAFKMSYINNHLEVLLEEGKVKVEEITDNKIKLLSTLLAGDKISVSPQINMNKDKPLMVKSVFKPQELTIWKTKDILFENTPLSEVIRQIELSYNVKIKIDNPALNKETFTGHFNNDPLDAILEVISFSIHKQYQYTDSLNITIHN